MANIPCPQNCAQCCGIFPIPLALWEKHKDKAQYEPKVEIFGEEAAITPLNNDSWNCVFLSKDLRCLVYEDRPQICRDYGDKKCPCPYYTDEGIPRTRQDRRRTLREIDKTNCQAFRLMETIAKEHGWTTLR